MRTLFVVWHGNGVGLACLIVCVRGWDFFSLFHMCIVSLNMVEIIFFSPPFFYTKLSALYLVEHVCEFWLRYYM